MLYFEKIQIGESLLRQSLSNQISAIQIRKNGKELKIELHSGIILFLIYTPFEQYSYTIQFSASKLDRVRFDNFDDRWNVESRPHHFHQRFQREGMESPMTGDPKHDLPLFLAYLK